MDGCDNGLIITADGWSVKQYACGRPPSWLRERLGGSGPAALASVRFLAAAGKGDARSCLHVRKKRRRGFGVRAAWNGLSQPVCYARRTRQ